MKSIVFLDLDGTFWDREQVPESALKAVCKAEENGHLVLSNTGRSRSSAESVLEGLPLSGQVYSSGSEIWLDGKQIFCSPLGADRTHRLLDEISKWDVAITLEGSNTLFHNQKARDHMYEKMKDGVIVSAFMEAKDISEIEEEEYADIMKISLHGLKPGQIDDLLARENMVITEFSIIKEDSGVNGEITDRNLTKGTAFQPILESLGPEAKNYQTIALGDSENDLPMFEAAEIAVAMGNADPAIQARADYVTKSIHEDGLYHAFERLGLLDDNAAPEWTKK
ncbi:HAD-IIB family hydrolase [Allobaculum sp. JKK-2023]|uniref:HAD-IIB family hydrolase n=1 Tax=Allobaculum sp. JKK-2023 TaxID=3108943 RepID=UPI002B052594|nr:HAD-IIB family hydrolase [Allobaculum sp. JKK-2023]